MKKITVLLLLNSAICGAVDLRPSTSGTPLTPTTVSASGCIQTNASGSVFRANCSGDANSVVVVSSMAVQGSGGLGVTNRVSAGSYSTTAGTCLNCSSHNTLVNETTEVSTLTVQGNAFSVGVTTLVVTGGNVGIGTTSPATKLHMSSGTLTVDGTGAAITVAGGNVYPVVTASATITSNSANFGYSSGTCISGLSVSFNSYGTGVKLHYEGYDYGDTTGNAFYNFMIDGAIPAATSLSATDYIRSVGSTGSGNLLEMEYLYSISAGAHTACVTAYQRTFGGNSRVITGTSGFRNQFTATAQ